MFATAPNPASNPMASRRHALGSAVSRYLSKMSEMSVKTVNAAAKVWVISFKCVEMCWPKLL